MGDKPRVEYVPELNKTIVFGENGRMQTLEGDQTTLINEYMAPKNIGYTEITADPLTGQTNQNMDKVAIGRDLAAGTLSAFGGLGLSSAIKALGFGVPKAIPVIGRMGGAAAGSAGVDLAATDKSGEDIMETALRTALIQELIPGMASRAGTSMVKRVQGITPQIQEIANKIIPKRADLFQKFGITEPTGGQLTGSTAYKAMESKAGKELLEERLIGQNEQLAKAGMKEAAKVSSVPKSSSGSVSNFATRLTSEINALSDTVVSTKKTLNKTFTTKVKDNLKQAYPTAFDVKGNFKLTDQDLIDLTSDPNQLNQFLDHFKAAQHKPEFKELMKDIGALQFSKIVSTGKNTYTGIYSVDDIMTQWNDPMFKKVKAQIYTKDQQRALTDWISTVKYVNENMGSQAENLVFRVDPDTHGIRLNENANTNFWTGVFSGSKVTGMRGIWQKFTGLFGKHGMPVEDFTRMVLLDPKSTELATQLMRTPITSPMAKPLMKALVGTIGNLGYDFMTYEPRVKVTVKK